MLLHTIHKSSGRVQHDLICEPVSTSQLGPLPTRSLTAAHRPEQTRYLRLFTLFYIHLVDYFPSSFGAALSRSLLSALHHKRLHAKESQLLELSTFALPTLSGTFFPRL